MSKERYKIPVEYVERAVAELSDNIIDEYMTEQRKNKESRDKQMQECDFCSNEIDFHEIVDRKRI